MNKTLWLEPLNVTEDQLQGWIAEKPKEVGTAYWCLKNNFIDESNYINWAKTHFQIPAMDHNYKNFNIDNAFWLQIQSVSNWSEHLIPLYFYENTLFVLSAEPLEMNWSFHVQFVLGTPEQLTYFWSKLNSNEQQATPIVQDVQIKQPEPDIPPKPVIVAEPIQAQLKVEPLVPPAPELKAAAEFPADMPSTNTVKPLSEIMQNSPDLGENKIENDNLLNLDLGSKKSDEPLSGFDALETQFNFKSDQVNADLLSTDDFLEGFDSADKASSSIEGFDDLEGFNTPDKPSPSIEGLDGLEGLGGLNLKLDTSSDPFASLNLNLPEEKPEEIVANLNTEKAPADMPPLSTTTKSLRLNQVVEAQTEIKPESNVAPVISVPLDLMPTPTPTQSISNSSAQMNVGSLNCLNKINQYFKKSLVFELSDNHVSVSHQDGSWDLSSLKNIELTKTPSLFNFCIISKLPFHGKISDKDSLKSQLFQALNISNSGEHITLMPIINNDSINHFVFALGDKHNLKHLNELEKTVPEILNELTA